MKIDRKTQLDLIKSLSKLKEKDVQCLLSHISDDAIDCLCECVFNVLNTDLKLSSKKKNSLKKLIKTNCSTHRLKQISNKKNPISKRRRALKMEGKGLPFLLSAAIPFLTNLIFGAK